MFYIHKDRYPNDQWWKIFQNVLNYRNKNYKKINLKSFEDFKSINNQEDILLTRLGHDPEEKSIIGDKLEEIYKSWDKVFPSKDVYNLYDDKLLEYRFLKSKNLPTIKTQFVKNKRGASRFLSKQKVDFPVVIKKRGGAGANYVWKIHDISNIKEEKFPLLIQNYIETDFDLRVFYIGDKLFSIKRNHKNNGQFPYGNSWYNVDTGYTFDILNYLDKDFLMELWDVFYKELGSPTMAFDIIFLGGDPKILEFSYCFSKSQVFQSNHYYTLSEFNREVYFKGDRYCNYEYLKNIIGIEVIKWLNKNN